MQFVVVLEAVKGILAGFLVAFLFGIAFAASTFRAIDDNLCVEERRTVIVLCFVEQDVFQGDSVLLTPFQQFAFEVHFLISQLVNVDETMQYLLRYEALAMGESPVKIDGTNECFEGIAGEIAVVRLVVFVATDKLVETYLLCQISQ